VIGSKFGYLNNQNLEIIGVQSIFVYLTSPVRSAGSSSNEGLFCVMAWYVYIIRSHQDGTYYKGSSENPLKRLNEHNAGLSKYTSGKIPWELVYAEELPTKKEMLIRERKLKRGNPAYFESLIRSEKNIITSL